MLRAVNRRKSVVRRKEYAGLSVICMLCTGYEIRDTRYESECAHSEPWQLFLLGGFLRKEAVSASDGRAINAQLAAFPASAGTSIREVLTEQRSYTWEAAVNDGRDITNPRMMRGKAV